MSVTKITYGANTALTITLNSLANAAARQSAARDNTTDLSLDDLIGGRFQTAAGTLAAAPVINIYVAALTGDGTHYSGGATGADAAFTMPSNKYNLRLGVVVPINTAGTPEDSAPFSIANLFGGNVPKKYAIVVENLTGLALDATVGGVVYYQGVTLTTV
jgi:hypothetical protein